MDFWMVARGYDDTVWVAVRDFQSWQKPWKRRFWVHFGFPAELVTQYKGIQVVQVAKSAALTGGWGFLKGKAKLRRDVPEAILLRLPIMEPTNWTIVKPEDIDVNWSIVQPNIIDVNDTTSSTASCTVPTIYV